MSLKNIVGLVILAMGITALCLGINASHSVGERVYEDFMGRFTDRTTWYIIGGIAAIVGGIGVMLINGRRIA